MEHDREKRILDISDKLLDKIEKSITEIDRCVIKTKERTKNVEYDFDLKKPVNECIEEKENIDIIEGMIDKMGLKQLVSTLKDIKDIHTCLNEEKTTDEDDNGIVLLGDIDQDTLEQEYYDSDDDDEDE